MKDFQVVITTYNRRENIIGLVNSINSCEHRPTNIIVVDTTPDENEELKKISNVRYIRSNPGHQNQPYKRLVGALASDSEYLIFMDDDLIIQDNKIFSKLLPLFERDNVVAFTSSIDYSEFDAPGAFVSSFPGKALLFLTGLPVLRPGKLGLLGHIGRIKGDGILTTEYLHGPVMGFKRSVFLKIPDPLMLSIFDRQMAIPEDKIISIRASKYGRLLYFSEMLVRHPKIDSTYFKNICDHTARVHFSRFVLNMEMAKGKPAVYKTLYTLQFYYYSFWRKMIAGLRAIINPEIYYQKLLGFRLAGTWVKEYKNGLIPIQNTIIEEAILDAGNQGKGKNHAD